MGDWGELYSLAKLFFDFGENPRLIQIVLPSVPKVRKATLKRPNYPSFDFEVAPDDVLSAMRIYSLLTPEYGEKIKVVFHKRIKSIGELLENHVILIGGPPTNNFTEYIVKDCPIRFEESESNRIIRSPDSIYHIEPLGDRKSPITKDYCLITRKLVNNQVVFIIAGLRAYGQEWSHVYLGKKDFYFKIQDIIGSINFQILIEVEIKDRSILGWRIAELRKWDPIITETPKINQNPDKTEEGQKKNKIPPELILAIVEIILIPIVTILGDTFLSGLWFQKICLFLLIGVIPLIVYLYLVRFRKGR